METEKFYFRVGIFSLAVIGLFVWYLTVFHAGGSKEGVIRYAAYFEGSVAGLAKGASVRLKGLDVGTVTDIHFVARDDDRILVLMNLSANAPVREDTEGTVAFQGITGTTYLELEDSKPKEPAPLLEAKPGEEYPVIRTHPSSLQILLANAPDILTKLTQISGQLAKLLSDPNITALQGLLVGGQNTLGEATETLREIRMLTRELRDDPSVIIRGPAYGGYKTKDAK